MVKVNAPAMSLDASGSLAGILTFSKWKGRNYVRQLVRPANPKSALQVGVRSMFRFLSQEWAGIIAAEKATWQTKADQDIVSPFNAFMKENMQRWRLFHLPSMATPAAETMTPGTIVTPVVTGAEGHITLTDSSVPTADNDWGYAIFRDPAEIINVNWDCCIAVIPTNDVALNYVDSPLAAGLYHYRWAMITEDGLIGTACTDTTGSAT